MYRIKCVVNLLFTKIISPYKRLWSCVYIVLSFILPFIVVTCLLKNPYLRNDYIFHTNVRARVSIQYREHEFLARLRLDVKFKNLVNHTELFQNVTQNGRSIVFSAYLDDTKNSYKIRAIGVKERALNHQVYCKVWYPIPHHSQHGQNLSAHIGYMVVSGYVDEHPEIFERSWSVVHYMCPLQELPPNPYAVSIVTAQDAEPLNFVRIKYTEDEALKNYTICLHSAFNFKTDMSMEIVEWIEMQKLLGAEHFVVYNFSSHPKNDEVLNWYIKTGTISLIQWDLPIIADVHVIGQVAAMTDCLFRNYYSSKFIAHLDLDEFIVPRRPGVTTVPELLSQMDDYCAYITLCNVFSVVDGQVNEPFSGKALAEKFKLNTLLVRQRQTFVYGARDRSKMILRTACIEKAGIHLINSYASEIRSEVVIQTEDALMQHYRYGRPQFSKAGNKIQDDFMLKFASKLIPIVTDVWRRIENETSYNSFHERNDLIYL